MREAEFETVPEGEAAGGPQEPSSSPPGPDAPAPTPEPAEPEPKPEKTGIPKHPGGRKAEGEDTVADLLRSLEGVRGSATIEVQRHARGGALEYIVVQDIEGFSLEEVKASYGGGRYVCTVTDPGGGYLFTRTVKIAGKPKQPHRLCKVLR